MNLLMSADLDASSRNYSVVGIQSIQSETLRNPLSLIRLETIDRVVHWGILSLIQSIGVASPIMYDLDEPAHLHPMFQILDKLGFILDYLNQMAEAT